MNNTPPPWKVNEDCPEQVVTADENFLIAEITSDSREEDIANAAFIVRAVNAHEELLAIIKEIYDNEKDIARRRHSDVMRFRMEEAIAKAEGK